MRCIAFGLFVLMASRVPALAQGTVPDVAPIAAWPAELAAPDRFHLFLPGRDWALGLELRGFNVVSAEQPGGGRASVMLDPGDDEGSMVTAFLEVLPDAESAAACRAIFRARGKLHQSNKRTTERDGMVIDEGTIARLGSHRLGMRNVNVFLDVGDTCVDVHISKSLFEAKDQPKLDALIDAIRIERPFVPTSVDWLPYALASPCAMALPALEAIERLESGSHRLDRETWRRSAATLVDCRLAQGRAPDAVRGLEAVLREDADYAPLHYTMAAARAKSADVPGTLDALRRARAAPAVPGFELPDPLSNPAFDLVEADPAFRAGVATLFPGPPETARPVRFPVAGHGALVLDVPGGWRAHRDQERPGHDALPTYELLGARGARHASMLITIVPASAFKNILPPADGPTLDTCVTTEDRALAGKEAPPAEWKMVTSCTARVGGLLLHATIFTQVTDAPELALAKAMLAGARHEPAPSKR